MINLAKRIERDACKHGACGACGASEQWWRKQKGKRGTELKAR